MLVTGNQHFLLTHTVFYLFMFHHSNNIHLVVCKIYSLKLKQVSFFLFLNFLSDEGFKIHTGIKITINPLPDGKFLDSSKFKAFADDKINVTKKIKISLEKGRKHGGKRRKCWSPAFSPFPTMFSKALFFHYFSYLTATVQKSMFPGLFLTST